MPGKSNRRIAQTSISAHVRSEYETLEEMQIRKGPTGALFYASKPGERWFLYYHKWPIGNLFLVKEDGSVWAGDRFAKKLPASLEMFDPTGETATQCDDCDWASLPGENRHRKSCPHYPLP